MTAKQQILSVIAETIRSGHEDAFLVLDLNDVRQKLQAWRQHMPRVEPFYAVKCNDDELILKQMVNWGLNFDCASKGEIAKVMSLGCDPSKIIYANPCKQLSHLRYAESAGVEYMTFDNADELYKIKQACPSCKLILRLLPDDSKSVCRLGNKFGAHLSVVEPLLKRARELGLSVEGVSYHVGSGCYDKSAFIDAVYLARRAFDIAEELGMPFHVLDIGGGFPGDAVSEWKNSPVVASDGRRPLMFPEIARQITATLDELFPHGSGVRIIAEPGRYFVHSCATLAVSVIAKRGTQVEAPTLLSSPSASSEDEFDASTLASNSDNETPETPSSEGTIMYYVNEGVYGTFNNIIYDHACVVPWCNVLQLDDNVVPTKDRTDILSSLWGPTCDGLDCIVREMYLPNLEVGSWLYFENMGAYTSCAAASFNGFELPSRFCLPLEDESVFE